MNAKILVVDDERMLVETIAYNLEKEGFEVVTAFDGESALVGMCSADPGIAFSSSGLSGASLNVHHFHIDLIVNFSPVILLVLNLVFTLKVKAWPLTFL